MFNDETPSTCPHVHTPNLGTIMSRAWIRALTVIVLAAGTLVGLPAPGAFAATVLFGDGGDSYAAFTPGSTIIISGNLSAPPGAFTGNYDPCVDSFGLYAADVYVVPHGS